MKIKNEYREFTLLLKSVPPIITVLFIMSVFSMNLLANKSIALPFDWLALDCGVTVSWLAFLLMDTITKHFGPKGATELSIFAIFINLLFCLLMFLGSIIPGIWGEACISGSEEILNHALDRTIGGTWYVLLGSTIAFISSAFVNNFLNFSVGKLFKSAPDGVVAYAARSYISTAVGQFCDNLVFAFIVSHFFFGWSILQCVTCALTGMAVELLCEIVFSPFGFNICQKWKAENIGSEYFEHINEKGSLK